MWQNSRCSILFHLLVPGGKCDTCSTSPVSSASPCNATFHSRFLVPLLPPPSAVISTSLARPNRFCPICRHHCPMLATANCAVSWLMPTLTQPSLLVRS